MYDLERGTPMKTASRYFWALNARVGEGDALPRRFGPFVWLPAMTDGRAYWRSVPGFAAFGFVLVKNHYGRVRLFRSVDSAAKFAWEV
jgi:hypothetical protein